MKKEPDLIADLYENQMEYVARGFVRRVHDVQRVGGHVPPTVLEAARTLDMYYGHDIQEAV